MPDYQLGDTVYVPFTTRSFSTGAPTTLAGSPVVDIYEDASLTQITAAETLSVDFDSITGLNMVTVTATSGNGFGTGQSYTCVITTGTVGGVSVVGEVIGHFTIEMSAARLEIGVAGAGLTEAGGTGDHLTAIDLPNQTMDITGNLSGSVGSVTGAVGSVTGAVGSVTGNVGGSTASVTGAVGSVTGAVGSVAGNVDGNVTGSVGSLTGHTNQTADHTAALAALNDLSAAQVNAEVVDALNTDTYAEPGQGVPAATASLAAKLGYLYKAWRNRTTQTAAQYALYNDDASTVDHVATVSDDSTTFDKGEVASGP